MNVTPDLPLETTSEISNTNNTQITKDDNHDDISDTQPLQATFKRPAPESTCPSAPPSPTLTNDIIELVRSRSNSSTSITEQLDDLLEPATTILQNNDSSLNLISFKYILENFSNKNVNIHDLGNNIGTKAIEVLDMAEKDEIDSIVKLFTDIIIEAAKKSIGLKTNLSSRKTNVPWWNKDCHEAILNYKKKLNRYKKTKSCQDHILLKNARARSRFITKNSKTLSWQEFTSSINQKTSPKIIWNKINSLKGNKFKTIPDILYYNQDKIVSTPNASESFAHFFQKNNSDENYDLGFISYRNANNKVPELSQTNANYNLCFDIARDCGHYATIICLGKLNVRTAQLLVRPHGVLRSSCVASGSQPSDQIIERIAHIIRHCVFYYSRRVSMTADYRFTVLTMHTSRRRQCSLHILCP
ncbi:hypothetical protein ACI65C_011701 [Semiaphis heraclei]